MNKIILLALAFCISQIFFASSAENAIFDFRPSDISRIFRETNKWKRIGLETGSPGGLYLSMGNELGQLVEDTSGKKLRVIVQTSAGSIANLRDLEVLEYTDLALVQADVLSFIRDKDIEWFNKLNKDLTYVTELHTEYLHILMLGADDPDPKFLTGKRISVGKPNGGTEITMHAVLKD